MSYHLSDKQYQGVCAASAEMRYSHFIGQVASWEEVWGLHGSSGWLQFTINDNVYMPLWPHPKYAEAFALDEKFSGDVKPRAISLLDFCDEWLPKLQNSGIGVAVLPVAGETYVAVSSMDLGKRLQDELDRIE